tara:strand:+ start:1389 stop:1550 length:162 start_codon:yes stop_codon:yes gene_type:complete
MFFLLGVLALEAALPLGAFAFEAVFFPGAFFEAVLSLEEILESGLLCCFAAVD